MRSIGIVAVIILACSIIGCSHAMVMKAGDTDNLRLYLKNTEQNIEEEAVALRKPLKQDGVSIEIYNSLVKSFKSAYKGRVVENYSSKSTDKVDRIVELNASSIKYGVNKVRSFILQWPFSLAYLPELNGISYNMEIPVTVTIKQGGNGKVLAEDTLVFLYDADYLSQERAFAVNGCVNWVSFAVPSLVAAFRTPAWDEDMKKSISSQLDKVTFGYDKQTIGGIISKKIISLLNGLK